MSNLIRVEKLKPEAKRYVKFIEDHLYVEVYPSGKKTWRLRKMVDGRQIIKTLGDASTMSLYEARMRRDDFLLSLGISEGEEDKDAAFKPRFGQIAAEWMKVKCIPQTEQRNITRQQMRLDKYVLPVLGELRCDEITAPIVLQLLRQIENDGHYSLAHAVATLISMILRFGEACGYKTHDVVPSLRGALIAAKVTHFATIHDPVKIRELLLNIDSMPVCQTKFGLLLCAYTFCRPTEVREARWSEIDFENREWRIPAERMKMRRPHIVPLARQVLDLLSLAKYASLGSQFVLPSSRDPQKCICADAYKTALRRMGYEKDMMTAHGFRSMASTVLNEAGWPLDAIERQLAHVDRNKVRAAYNHADFLNVRVKMMQWYVDYLDALREQKPAPPIQV